MTETKRQPSSSPPPLPSKRFYRQRAHCNPWSDHSLDYPTHPDDMNWTDLYPGYHHSPVRFVDIGCGFGGLLFKLALAYPQEATLGVEIRIKVCDFVQEKIHALRSRHPNGEYDNIACLRTNAMKFLPNFFHKGQLYKLFFLYPDPHFKRSKHKWRIVSPALLDVYAYLLDPSGSGRVYIATDIDELAEWMITCFNNHPLFTLRHLVSLKPSLCKTKLDLVDRCDLVQDQSRVVTSQTCDQICRDDPVIDLLMQTSTDESCKATREGRGSTIAVFDRIG